MARYVRNAAAPAVISSDDVKSFADHARKLFDDEVALRMGKSASDLNRLAEVLRTTSARLDGTFTAPYFQGAAQQIDRAAELLKHANTREIADAVQRVAKSSPLLFIGGALALGLGLGRFLRSSALPSLPSPSTARTTTTTGRKQRQPSFSNQRDES